MNKKFWAIGVILAITSTNTGCVSCCHQSYAKVLKKGPDCDLPASCRGQIYVFMIHGGTPTTDNGLNALREKLADEGFAKVGIGELTDALPIAFEIKDIAKCNPEARFVLIGYDVGASAAVLLARELTARTIPVEGVVLLDPLACGRPSGVRTLLVTSGTSTSTVTHSDHVVVGDASHFQLPAHPQTVAVICDLLKDIATQNYQPQGDPVPAWSYPHAARMWPIPVARGDEWDILAERGGVPSPIGTQVLSQAIGAPLPPPPLSTSAGAVMIKP